MEETKDGGFPIIMGASTNVRSTDVDALSSEFGFEEDWWGRLLDNCPDTFTWNAMEKARAKGVLLDKSSFLQCLCVLAYGGLAQHPRLRFSTDPIAIKMRNVLEYIADSVESGQPLEELLQDITIFKLLILIDSKLSELIFPKPE